jgi:uncharacterized protein YbaR (Trm112 family)
MNPSGVLLLEKRGGPRNGPPEFAWQCPLTAAPLRPGSDVFCNESLGLVYPVLQGIPMLRPEHVIVASKLV